MSAQFSDELHHLRAWQYDDANHGERKCTSIINITILSKWWLQTDFCSFLQHSAPALWLLHSALSNRLGGTRHRNSPQ